MTVWHILPEARNILITLKIRVVLSKLKNYRVGKCITLKIYKVEAVINGKSHALRVEGAQNIPEAVKAAEAILNTLYTLNAEIRSVCAV